jgi:hypothetical protein
MAQFTKVHGDYQPVVVLDQGVANSAGAGWSNGLNAVVSGATVQPQGPKLDYFTISAASGSHFSTSQVNTIIQTIQQLATVYIYEYTSASTDTLAVAVYPTDAWSTAPGASDTAANVVAAVNTALTNAGTANTTTGSMTATFTN